MPRYCSFDQPPQNPLGFSLKLTWKCCVDLFCRELASKGHNLDPTPEAVGAVSSEGQLKASAPLVGASLWAAERLQQHDSSNAFQRYCDGQVCNANSASAGQVDENDGGAV